jgi:hypothetical protein
MTKYRHFELIHMEKMTPRFLNLKKTSGPNDSLEKIKRDDGLDFESSSERYRYIRDFYSAIYNNNTPDRVINERAIEEFLGPEICKNPVVQNSKLTQAEYESFEHDLTLFRVAVSRSDQFYFDAVYFSFCLTEV